MPLIVKRLLLKAGALVGAFLGFALCGAALGFTSWWLGLLGALCLVASAWTALWVGRSPSTEPKAIKPLNPQFFSPTALRLSERLGERLLWQSRQPLLTLWHWGVGYVGLNALVFAVALLSPKIATLLWIGGTIALAVRVLIWHRTLTCVTSRQILGISGLVESKHASIPLGPYLTYQPVVNPVSEKLSRLRLISAPYGTLEVRSRREGEGGVLRIGPIGHVESFAQLVRSRR